MSNYKERIEQAVDLAFDCGTIDGAHHKMWVIDQMLRILLADKYEEHIKAFAGEEDENGDTMYWWDEGIAP